MVTVSHIVKKYIQKRPFIEESLHKKIINYGALAEEILPEVENEMGEKIKHSAVMMAIRRYSDEVGTKSFRQIKFKQNDLMLRSDLVEITIYKSNNSGELIEKLYEFVDLKKGDFLSVVAGVNEISIITNERNEKNFLQCVKKSEIKHIERDLSSLTINIPEDSIDITGIFYLITKSLAWENISIIEIISTWSEMGCIIRTKDVSRAFDVVKNVVEENK